MPSMKQDTPALTPPPMPQRFLPRLKWRFNRFLERHLPEDLYRRTLLIVVLPIMVLLLVITGVLLDRHWEEVTKRLSKEFGREVGLIVQFYDRSPKTPETLDAIRHMVRTTLDMDFSIEKPPLPPVRPRPWYSILHYRLAKYIRTYVPGRPFWVDASNPQYADVRIQVDGNTIFRFRPAQYRVYASSTPYLLLWLGIATVIVLFIALLFLRKQIAPVIELASAMQAFGKGHPTPPLHPRGAREVQAATRAFLAMQQRIERHVEQRTTMLAGISHDLRTILTRFRLQLSMLDADPQHIAALKRDVDEMQRMLQGYMDFVRGAEEEPARSIDICTLLKELQESLLKTGKADRHLHIRCEQQPLSATVRPGALRRALMNVLENALRHAGREVHLQARLQPDGLFIIIDDDGPGIPPAERDRVFRPFVRLDDARNQDTAGNGLGLAIARDLVLSHGGNITLKDSPLGGLRVEICLPQ